MSPNEDNETIIGFGIPEEQTEFIKRHSLFFDRFPNLRSAFYTAFIREMSTAEPVDRVVFYLGRLCVEDFLELLLLCGNGYGIGAMKILRGMFECAVTASYLQQNSEEAENFLDYHWIAKHKLAQAIKETMGTDAIPKDIFEKFKENYQSVRPKFMVTDCKKCGTQRLNHTWTKLDFVSMARKAGKIGELKSYFSL